MSKAIELCDKVIKQHDAIKALTLGDQARIIGFTANGYCAPRLARMLKLAIEQRDRMAYLYCGPIAPTAREYQIEKWNIELDRILQGES